MITPLYLKTSYSFLTSLITVDNLIDFAKKNKLNTLCICDDNMYGVMEFIKKTTLNNIKPIIGLDCNNYLLYAKNYNGYQNLLKISTIKSERTITIDDLQKFSSDLICILINKDLVDEIHCLFKKEDFYLGFNSQEDKFLFKRVSLNKTLCLNKDDLETLKYLMMLRDNKTLSDEYSIDGNPYYRDILERDQSIYFEIFDKCNVVLPKYKLNLPDYCKYNDTQGLNSDEYLYNLSIIGLNKRLNNQVTEEYKKRLLYELDVIKEMGFSNYFLIVYDYILYAKKNNILVGPGRGSAAGSLVSYSLGITEVDPIKYDLLFERFLNKDRITMPDIDTDFPDNKRDEVIRYVTAKYGLKNVSGIITFVPFGSKMVLRDMGRVLNIPLYMIDDLCKNTYSNISLQENYQSNFKFKGIVESDLKLKKLYEVAIKLEGLPRHTSIHAAGIIMANSPLDDLVPLSFNNDMYLCGYEASYLEEMGLFKMDFLGIKNLTTIQETFDLVEKYTQVKLNFNKLPLHDEKTNELFKQGDTLGIFQFESSGMREFLKNLQPENFTDIYNANAFFRPGPSDNISQFIKRRHGEMKVDYIDESFKDILESTKGIIVYQEQIMLIARKMAGFSLGEADILRRAMSKKKLDVLKDMYDKFLDGAVKNNYTVELANRVYNLILNFASYGFNKSHSVAYSMVSYKMAYLKANYKLYFYVALLNSVVMDSEKTISYIKEMKKNNIKLVKPDINKSTNKYEIHYDSVILPFTLIKGFSNLLANKILESRQEKFIDIYDFFSKVVINNITENNITMLIDSGCLDSFGYSRSTIYENLNSLLNYGKLTKDLDPTLVLKPELELKEEFSKDILIANEKNSYGFYLTNHPVSFYKEHNEGIMNLKEVSNYFNKNIICIGIVEKIKEVTTKKNELMAFILISDEETSLDCVLFPKVYSLCKNIKKGDILKIYGKIEKRSDYQVIVNKVEVIKE